MPRGEFICRTKLPLQDILFTLISTLQATVFSCSYNSVEDYTVHITPKFVLYISFQNYMLLINSD